MFNIKYHAASQHSKRLCRPVTIVQGILLVSLVWSTLCVLLQLADLNHGLVAHDGRLKYKVKFGRSKIRWVCEGVKLYFDFVSCSTLARPLWAFCVLVA